MRSTPSTTRTPPPPMTSTLRRRHHRLRATDGWELDVVEVLPAGRPHGLVIASHAMMVDRRTLLRDLRGDRPSLVTTLAAAGFWVLVPDLRGHGASGPRAEEGGRWGFEDLVDDMDRYAALAAELAPPALPRLLVGHSLGALVGLAWLGRAAIGRPGEPAGPPGPAHTIAAQVCLATDLWDLSELWGDLWGDLRRPRAPGDTLRRLLQRGLLAGASAIAERWGRVPVRRFGLGSNDEALEYWRDFSYWARAGRWVSRGGVACAKRAAGADRQKVAILSNLCPVNGQLYNYSAALATIPCPTLHVVSAGDRLHANPRSALRFSLPLRRREVWHLGAPTAPGALRELRPGHMGVVTDPSSAPLWQAIAAWLRARLANNSGAVDHSAGASAAQSPS